MHAGIEMCKTVDNVWGEVRILELLGSNIFLPQALHDFRERDSCFPEDSPGNL